jgi:hypothetical protein
MAANNLVWYAGRCLKRAEHDKGAQLEAAVQQIDGAWRPIESRKALFKNMDSLEWRSTEARHVRLLEWVAFTLTPTGLKAKPWQAGQHRRLYWYADYSAEGGQEQLHRRLSTRGVKLPHLTGIWILRCANDEVLLLDLKQQEGAAHLAGSPGKVSAYRFDPTCVTTVTTDDGDIELYDLNNASNKCTYDWTSDDAFALRIARAAADAGDVHAHNLIAWLDGFAKRGRSLTPVDPSDIVAANDAIRAGKMAKRLADDQDLLRKFIDAFTGDERINGVVRSCAAQIAEEERDAERSRAGKTVAVEIATHRQNKLQEFKDELDKIKQSHLAQLEEARKQRLKELKVELDQRQAADEEALRCGAGARRAAVEASVLTLENQHVALSEEVTRLRAAEEEANSALTSLLAGANEVSRSIEALRREADDIHKALLAERATLTALEMKYPIPRMPAATTIVSTAKLGENIAVSKLLSTEGKKLMMQFAALMLAGEIPVLCGPGVRDFLAIAERMLSGGRAVRIEADPTIITFEDLWVRPGLGVSTALGHALRSAAGAAGEPRTSLAVIERAERSGARFWYPSLSDFAEQGDLPRRLLMCATVDDASCDEASALFAHAVRLDVNDPLASDAEFALAMARTNASVPTDELDPGAARADATLAAADLIAYVKTLGAARSARALRVLAQARDMDSNASAVTFIKLFTTSGGTASIPLRSVPHA